MNCSIFYQFTNTLHMILLIIYKSLILNLQMSATPRQTLQVQTSTRPCSAPSLNGGHWVPKQDTYNHEAKLTYSCDNGRKPAVEGMWTKSTCEDGTWAPEPQCIESVHACGAPPQIPHAVIILQGYQDVFAVDTELQYECEDGYTVDGSDNKTSIYCISGNWTEGPVCSKRGASTASNGTERDGRSQYTTVDHCGVRPLVANGDVVRESTTFLLFQCNSFYTQVGDATVKCHNDGRWSQLPICEDAFCVLDPARFSFLTGRLSEVIYLKEGEEKYFSCTSYAHSSYIRCINGEISWTECCFSLYHYYGWCG